jgi:hypothetical protein
MVLNGYRYGIEMANDNDLPQVVALLFDSGATSLLRVIQLEPSSLSELTRPEKF